MTLQLNNVSTVARTRSGKYVTIVNGDIDQIYDNGVSFLNSLGDTLSTPTTKSGALVGIISAYRYMTNGRKIDAIREVRAVTGCGLKEAKETVETIMANMGKDGVAF